MPAFSSAVGLARLCALVHESPLAVALVSLPDCTILDMSTTATALTGLAPHSENSIDLLELTSGDGAPRSTLSVVARDDDHVYAIALFTRSRPGTDPLEFENGVASAETMEDLLGPLFRLVDPRDDTDHSRPAPNARDRLAELELRFRRIALEIDAVGLGPTRGATGPEIFSGLGDLTERQREILERLMRGDRVTTISRGMHLATSTVRNHLTTLYRKLDVHSQAELIERLHVLSE